VQEKNGDECTMPDGTKGKGTLTWYVNGKKQSGNPADYHPQDQQRIALVFAPAGTKLESLGTPPNSQALQTPVDETPFSGGTPSAPPSS
jgi:hypothetical protein